MAQTKVPARLEALALLTIKAEPQGRWSWTGYDQQGQRIGQQDNLTTIEEAIEETLRWLSPESFTEPKAPKKRPASKASKSPGPRSARK